MTDLVSSGRKVNLTSHRAEWTSQAREEAARISDAIGPGVLRVEHIGSTAIPDICAKPVVDLLCIVSDLAAVDSQIASIRDAGYQWRGENGLAGRRYIVRESIAGERLMHIHCYAVGHPAIVRLLAFRDYLLAYPDEASAYEKEKCRAAKTARGGAKEYAEAKSLWIQVHETRALLWYQARPSCGGSLEDALRSLISVAALARTKVQPP